MTTLTDLLTKGQTVYTVNHHTSRSGMQRAISVHVVTESGEFRDISSLVAEAGLYKISTHHRGLKVNGCGMDMGYAVVHNIASHVFGDGYALDHRWI